MKVILIISGIAFTAVLFSVALIAWLVTTSKSIDEMVKAEKDQFPS